MIKIFLVRLRVLFMFAAMVLAWGQCYAATWYSHPHSTHVSDVIKHLYIALSKAVHAYFKARGHPSIHFAIDGWTAPHVAS
ncbi:hypothetical protein FIBSPDRAFT_930126 [Athelia psychrophila]|uniref:Uncharacterized protein n=1 Tax=Athelia psychrophila TaxID=1759441 RepID=A0A166MPC5_9AGAM|nr:hypothetical protein FIBSPDRAFT_930126 [Fibularhizoctonia sp. CBS 109695]